MDPRIEKIERAQVYGLFHDGLLIYVGQTRLPLQVRLQIHASNSGEDLPIYQYLKRKVDDLHRDLGIALLDYETEKEALADLGHSTLNVEDGGEPVPPKYDWSPDEVDRLEELINDYPLTKISDELDIPHREVRNAAAKLGLREINDRIDWDRWDDKLGTMTDAELAEKIGCWATTVQERREKLGIQPYGRVDWDRWDHLLGEMTDRELAEKIGCSKHAVQGRRNKLGIEPYGHGTRTLTDEEVLEIRVRYETDPDASHRSLGEEYGLSAGTIGCLLRGETYQDVPMPSEIGETRKQKILARLSKDPEDRKARAGRAQDDSRTPSTHSQEKATS